MSEIVFEINENSFSSVAVANERQKNCIDSALVCVKSAISALENGELLDAVNVLIDEAEQYLSVKIAVI